MGYPERTDELSGGRLGFRVWLPNHMSWEQDEAKFKPGLTYASYLVQGAFVGGPSLNTQRRSQLQSNWIRFRRKVQTYFALSPMPGLRTLAWETGV